MTTSLSAKNEYHIITVEFVKQLEMCSWLCLSVSVCVCLWECVGMGEGVEKKAETDSRTDRQNDRDRNESPYLNSYAFICTTDQIGQQIMIKSTVQQWIILKTLQWRHNERDGVSNHQLHDCLLNRLFKAHIKVNIKAPCQWRLCGEFTGDRWIPRTNDQ